jgi:hypothetical protein
MSYDEDKNREKKKRSLPDILKKMGKFLNIKQKTKFCF